MNARERELRWSQLAVLLEPVHGPALATARRLCRSAADGDDLYAETVLRAFEKFHTLHDESRFKPWVFAILLSRHRSRSRLRFWRRFVPLDDAFPPGSGPAGDDGSRWDDDAVRARRVAAALDTLPAVQREAIVLFELEDHSIEDIAALQGASVAAVKSRLTRGRERLRHWYERHGSAQQREHAARAGLGASVPNPDSRGSNIYTPLAAAASGPRREEGHHE